MWQPVKAVVAIREPKRVSFRHECQNLCRRRRTRGDLSRPRPNAFPAPRSSARARGRQPCGDFFRSTETQVPGRLVLSLPSEPAFCELAAAHRHAALLPRPHAGRTADSDLLSGKGLLAPAALRPGWFLGTALRRTYRARLRQRRSTPAGRPVKVRSDWRDRRSRTCPGYRAH